MGKFLSLNGRLSTLYLGSMFLQNLNLDNKIGCDGCVAIANSLANHANLTDLDLMNNNIKDFGMEGLSEGLRTNKSVTRLNLSCMMWITNG